MTKGKWLILAAVVAVAGLFVALGLNRDTQVQHFTAKVERGDIHDVVEATGTINSVITVQVGSQVSGSIAKLNADFNSRVHKGDIVALIDPALFKGALLQATADLRTQRPTWPPPEPILKRRNPLWCRQRPTTIAPSA